MTNSKKQFESKMKTLEKVINSKEPIDPKYSLRHSIKVENARQFKEELDEIYYLINSDNNVKFVPLATFEKKVASADFSIIEFDGLYCKVACVMNFPYDNLWLIYTVSLSSI